MKTPCFLGITHFHDFSLFSEILSTQIWIDLLSEGKHLDDQSMNDGLHWLIMPLKPLRVVQRSEVKSRSVTQCNQTPQAFAFSHCLLNKRCSLENVKFPR